MFRCILSPAVALAFLTVSTLSMADEPAAAPKAVEPKTVAPSQPAKELFFVYAGSCSRSIRLHGTYDKIEDAFAAADKFRKDKANHITVRTRAHDRDYFGNAATEYRVYCQACRSRTWFVQATADSPAKAQEIVEKLNLEGRNPIEIVGHYAAK